MLKLRKFLSCTLALLLICGLPVSAFADTWYLENGDITVNAMESGQTVTQGAQVDVPDSAPVITQSDSSTPTDNTITINADAGATANVTIQDVNIVISDPAGSTQNHSGDAAVTIDVANGAQANVTLDGVNIDTRNTGSVSQNQYGDPVYNSGEAAVQITGNGDVTLELDGENTVKSSNNRAGVEKNTTDSSGKGNLTITDETGKDGSLNATGGVDGAGIGGAQAKDSSNITITGSAEVTATGGFSGAGIGGGNGGDGSKITITGSAEVTAKGGDYGAGIGGGFTKSGSNITISGSAEVTATGGVDGAGIGGDGGSIITISDSAEVIAQGGSGGAGIGGSALSAGSNITITGSAEVTAKGGASGAGIGGGRQSTGSSDITVSGDAQVKAQGGKDVQGSTYFTGAGAAIGEGGKWNNSTVVEVTPDTDALNEGWVATYAPGTTNLDTAVPNSLTYQGASGVANAKPIVKLEPTCTEDGHKAGFMVGNTQVGGQTLPATGHSFTNYVSDGNATYDQDGTKTAKCDHCDETHTLPDPGSKLVKPAESVTVSPKPAAVVEYSDIDESAFWQEVARQIEAAAPGDTIEVNAGGICTIPYWVIDAAVEHGVALSIHWRCGEDFIIDRKPDQQLWVYSFTTLPQLLGN